MVETAKQIPENKIHINNKEEIIAKTKELISTFKAQFPEKYKLNFLERNLIQSNKPVSEDSVKEAEKMRIKADVFNEVQFYNTTLENVKRALNWCNKNEVKIFRPFDFYAEMFKKDIHMDMIKKKLTAKKDTLIKKERERLNKKNKRFQKQYRHMKNLSEAKEKKKNLDAIDAWKSEIKKKKDGAADLDKFINQKNKKSKKITKRVGKSSRTKGKGGAKGRGRSQKKR